MTENDGRLEVALRNVILNREFSQLDLKQQLAFFCRTICAEMNVQRAGIWLLSDAGDSIESQIEWDGKSEQAKSGTILLSTDAESYLEAIKQELVLVIDDVMTDPRCAELAKVYLPQNGITSMLDCPLQGSDGLIGVMCIEHIGERRTWSEAERTFSTAIASLVSLCYESSARKDAETARAIRQTRLEQFADMTVGWLFETDADLRLQNVVGERPVRNLEIAPNIGRRPWEFEGLSPLNGSWDELKGLMQSRQPFQDMIIYSADDEGQRYYAEVAGRPQFDENGVFTGYVGASKDVTRRLRSQAELHASEQRYRGALKVARLGHWIWDETEQKCSYCSPELAEIYGVTVEEYLEKSASPQSDLDWFHPDDRERYWNVIAKAVEEQTGYEVQARIVRRDGSIRHLHEWTEAVFDEAGRFVATAGVLQDITDRVELQEQLQENAARLANLVDNLPGAVFRVKAEEGWPAVYRSKGYYRMFIGGDEEVDNPDSAGQLSELDIDAADWPHVKQEVNDAIAGNRTYEVEFGITTRSGKKMRILERGRPVRTRSGDVELEGLLIDVTEKHDAEEALIKAQRLEAVGQLTGGIAHDFNNLLAVIFGNLELVLPQLDKPDLRDSVESCIDATQRAADLTHSMLAFAKRARLRPVQMDLNKVAENARNWIGRTLPTNIEMNAHLADGLWKFKADRAGLETAILNMILNARDAMPEGGKLTLETTNTTIDEEYVSSHQETIQPGRYVVLAVSDSGAGIPPENLSRIFEPFFSTKGPARGTGLGLSMVQGFVEQSGGRVGVYSEVGVGTSFKLYFPALDKADVEDRIERPANAALPKNGRILLAEDEAGVLKVLVRVLANAGYEVTPVGSGEEAWRAFEKRSDFDLVITDVVMPGGLMGPQLARKIRAHNPDMPVIFLSGYAQEAALHGNGLRPEDIRLTKPLRMTEFLSHVDQALGAPR